MKTGHMIPMEIERVHAVAGAAGGYTRKARVTLIVEGRADTVEAIRHLCEAAPRALAAAATLIENMDSHLTSMGRGHDLSNVPGFEGGDFVGYIRALLAGR